ncbi:MAG: hypothetical protein M1541_05655 [Acidobacteria bacterium]|nr:hypothetical protein [Acidobacteriota bacterium]
MKIRTLVSSSLLILLAVLFAYGQPMVVKARIPFAFTVEGKVLPAGQYEFTPNINSDAIRVVGSGKGTGALAMVITMLSGAMHTTPQDAHIVFDKVGNTYTLSEIWEPTGDGYLVHATKGKHEHQVVNVPR